MQFRLAAGWFLLPAMVLPLCAEPVARRLNRYEYNATVRDLLGVEFQPASDFPADNYTNGFDNNAATLTVTPALLYKYLAAAKKIARAAVEAVPPPAAPEMTRHGNPNALGDLSWQRSFTWEGDYDFYVAIAGRSDPGSIELTLDDGPPRTLEAAGDFEGKRYAQVRLHVDAGKHRFRVRTPSSWPEYVEVRGPCGPVFPAIPPGYGMVFKCGHAPGQHTAACVRSNLTLLARRAWRRPLSKTETDRLLALASSGAPEQQMESGIEAILVSPAFLFRIENPQPKPGDYELASRLSYFLWSSMPDEELERLAGQRKLHDPAVLTAQAHRMLADPKAAALSENFAAQWLGFRNVNYLHRDRKLFPNFNADLGADMRRETELFFGNALKENRSILDFLTARYTFVNEPLAKLYGIPNITGDRFQRVDLGDLPRAGILTQASVLAVTSYATRTSPVLRGKWILDNILNEPPPPPPANVPALRDASSEPALTLRRQLEEHRASPACSACHARMDPLGFALENFDAIGRWRDKDGSQLIDPAGKLPDGTSFSGPAELGAILSAHPEAFATGITEKLLVFALGRGLNDTDRSTAREIAQQAAARNYRLSDLILGVAQRLSR